MRLNFPTLSHCSFHSILISFLSPNCHSLWGKKESFRDNTQLRVGLWRSILFSRVRREVVNHCYKLLADHSTDYFFSVGPKSYACRVKFNMIHFKKITQTPYPNIQQLSGVLLLTKTEHPQSDVESFRIQNDESLKILSKVLIWLLYCRSA